MVSKENNFVILGHTFTKIIEDPTVIAPYNCERKLYLPSSPEQSMYIWEMPLTVSSSLLNWIELAFGENFCAYAMTASGKVAENNRVCATPGNILNSG
jgi:hypothetical protein